MPIQMLSSRIIIRFIAYMAKLSPKGTKSLAHTQANARFLMKNPPLNAKLSTFSQNICVYANFSLPLHDSFILCKYALSEGRKNKHKCSLKYNNDGIF